MPTPNTPTAIAAPKRGAPKGNTNALRNGSRITRLIVGSLPKALKRQKSNILKYRRMLEDAVWEAKGHVSLTDSHLIHEATIAMQHEALCRSQLRAKYDTMSTADAIRCSEQILKSTTIRNRAIERLGLDVQQRNRWDFEATATAVEGENDDQ
jgi:hypothetical protein